MAETSSATATPTSRPVSSAGNANTGPPEAILNEHNIVEESSRMSTTEEPHSRPQSTTEEEGAANDHSSTHQVVDTQDCSTTRPGPQKAQAQKTHFFGISQGQGPPYPGFVNNNFDYYQKYPEDEWGEEWGENARVWKVYLDEAQIYDTETTEGWKDTLNVFLVFAGLFSAVEASFITVSIQALQPDYAQATAFLLMEQIALQRAIAKGFSPDTIASATFDATSQASPSTGDLWVNGLWSLSLALSLCVALAAVVIKQWIQEYVKITSGTSKAQARVRQFRFAGLERWGVPVIIGILPVLLHAALFLFLAGLVIFTLPLNGPIGSLTLALTTVTMGIYVTSMILSLIFLDCPYKTPIAVHLYDLVLMSHRVFHTVYSHSILYTNSAWAQLARILEHRVGLRMPRVKPFKFSPLTQFTRKGREVGAIDSQKNVLDLSSVAWLHLHSSNMTASGIASESISSLPASAPLRVLVSTLPQGFENAAAHEFTSCFSQPAAGPVSLRDTTSFSQVERLGRATLRLASPYGIGFLEANVFRFLTTSVPQEVQRSDRLKQLGYFGQIAETFPFRDGLPEDVGTPESRSIILLDLIRNGHQDP